MFLSYVFSRRDPKLPFSLRQDEGDARAQNSDEEHLCRELGATVQSLLAECHQNVQHSVEGLGDVRIVIQDIIRRYDQAYSNS